MVTPVSTLIVPPPPPRVIPLLVAKSKETVVCKIPPLNVNCVATGDEDGAAPKLASALIEIVPAEIVVIPV